MATRLRQSQERSRKHQRLPFLAMRFRETGAHYPQSEFPKPSVPTGPEQVKKRILSEPERELPRTQSHNPEISESLGGFSRQNRPENGDRALGNSLTRESEKAGKCRENTKKADVSQSAKRRLSEFTPGGQFPNQTEKLSGTDTSRNAPAFSRPGYGSLAALANNLVD